MKIKPDVITGNTISTVAELYQNDPAALETLVTVSRMLGIELDSQPLLFLGDHIQERVWALQAEDDIGDDETVESAHDDADSDEEEFIIFHYNDGTGPRYDPEEFTVSLDESLFVTDDDDGYDYEMSEDADGNITLVKSYTCIARVEEIDILSKKGKIKTRFIIVDDAGDLIDDNRGKGYKSREKADASLWDIWVHNS